MEYLDGNSRAITMRRMQSAACIIAAIASLGRGIGLGYTSPAVPDMEDPANEFTVSKDQDSWISSLSDLGALAGSLIAGPMIDILGRKTTVIFNAVPLSIGFLFILTSFSVPQVYVGRFLTGVCAGMTALSVPVYIAEVSSAQYRGIFVTCHQVGTQLGIAIVYSVGIALTWRWLAVFGQIVPLILVCSMFFMPETPRWLYQGGFRDAAEQKLQWLRGKGANIDVELKAIEKNITSKSDNLKLRDFKDPKLFKPLIMVMFLMTFNQLTGTHVITYNMESLFEAAGLEMSPQIQSVIVAFVGVCGTIPAVALMDRVGRKPLLITSFFILSLALGGMGAFFIVQKNRADFAADKLSWLPLTCLMIYKFTICFGASPVPFVVMSEVFPMKARGVASSISSSVCWIVAFVVSKTFHSMVDAMGYYGLYWFYGSCCFVAAIYVIVFVPETKNETLEQIENRNEVK